MKRDDSKDLFLDSLDELIFSNNKLEFIKQVREIKRCTLSDATEILGQRYKKLRAEAPQKFSFSDESFWDNFYS